MRHSSLRFICWAACVFFLLPFSFCLSSTLPPLTRFWQTEDSLPSNDVRTIAETPDGFLWVGTAAGLVRFDGLHFEPFGSREGALAAGVTKLLVTRDGTLWAACEGVGLVRVRGGVVTTFAEKEGLPSREVWALAEDSGGTLWVGTVRGGARWQDGHFIGLPDPGWGTLGALLPRRSGELWARFGHELAEWKDGAWAKVAPAPPDRLNAYTDLFEDAHGNVWAGSQNRSALRFDANGWRSFPVAMKLSMPGLTRFASAPGDEVYAGASGNDLWKLSGEKFVPVSIEDGSEVAMQTLCVDASGQLWVGTASNGLVQLSPRLVERVRIEPAGGRDVVQALWEVSPGVFWVAVEGMGVWRWEDCHSERISPSPEFNTIRYCHSILGARDGTIFVGSERGLWAFREGQGANRLTLPDWSEGDYVRSLAEDSKGTIWAGTGGGRIYRVQGGRAELFDAHLKLGSVHAIAVAPDGVVWVARYRGVQRFSEGRETRFSTADGLRTNDVRALCVDGSGTLWAGTSGGGLARWRGGRFQSIGPEAGMTDDTVFQIMDDSHRRLWLAGPLGISSLPVREIEAVLDGREKTANPHAFGRGDGMATSGCEETRPIRDHEGRLCFATIRGFVRVIPSPPFIPSQRDRVFLERLRVDGELHTRPPGAPWPASMDLGTGTRRVEITFTSPQFHAPENVRFRYRLSGLDEEWHDAGRQRTAVFAQLPAGRYRFEAMAMEPAGNWAAPVALDLELHPHFWDTGWFHGCSALVVILAVAAAVRLVVRHRAGKELARLERQHALEQERARIARDLHDELGAGLTKIGKLAEGWNDGAVTQATRDVVQALDEIVWTVNPRNDTLENVASYLIHYAEQFLRPAGIACRLDVPVSLPDVTVGAAVRHHLYAAVKEALNNAVKHGAPRQVNVGLDLDGDLLTVTVRDDGCGFTPTSTSAGGDGLANMEHRLEALGGRLLLQSQPGQGTYVTMQLRLNGGSQPCHLKN